MKKLLLILTSLLACLGSSAQVDELQNKLITVGDPVESIQMDTWYVIHNGGRPSYIYSVGVGNGKIANQTNMPDGSMAADRAPFLWRFVAARDGVDGHFYIQSGLGDYIGQLTTGSNNGTTEDPEYYFTSGKIEGESNWYWFMGNDGAMVMDNNTPPSTMAGWGTSVPTASSSNAAWQVCTVSLEDVDPIEGELLAIMSTYTTYNEYDFIVGTSAGEYPETAVNAFKQTLKDAKAIIDSEGEGKTAQQIKDANQAVKDAYDAVLAARNSFAMDIAPGYYVIKNALDFTESVDDGTGEFNTVHNIKAMYDNKGTASWKTFEEKAEFLFKVEATSTPKAYKLTNMRMGYTFDAISRSTTVTLSARDTLVSFDWRYDNVKVPINAAGETKPVTTVNIRLVGAPERDYQYAHAGGHSSGAGISGDIVGWSTGEGTEVGATDWYLEPIDEATAKLWIENSSTSVDTSRKIEEVQAIADAFEAQKLIAEDLLTVLDRNNPLIDDPAQISSPYTEASEGSIDGMLDGTTSNFWHSDWNSGPVAEGTHYFQVYVSKMPENFAFEYSRRPVTGDQITKWSVYGAGDPDATKAECELLAEVLTPLSAQSETLLSTVIPSNGFKYIRFYCEKTEAMPDTDGGTGRGYFHVGEFQMYAATQSTVATTPQAQVHASELNAMVEALNTWKAAAYTDETDPENAQFNKDYNAVIAANKAWTAVFVDPTEMRTALSAAKELTESMVEGKDPGMWSGASSSDIKSTIQSAEAYSNAGDYSSAKNEEFITKLTSQKENLMASANKIKEGKWYNIIFPSEELYENNNWDKSGAKSSQNEDGSTYGEGLFSKYMTVGNIANNGSEDNPEYVFSQIDGDVAVGQTLQWADEDADDAERHQFRFIAVGDSAFMIQNRATGLFLKAAGTSGLVRLSPMPTLFKQEVLGYGLNLLKAVRIDGTAQSYLHAQNDMSRVVTWNANTLGSNSCLFINEAEDVASDYVAPDFNYNVYCGTVVPMCYPVAVKLTDEGAKIYGASVEGTTVTLSPVKGNAVEAGVPFLLVSNLWEGDKEYVKEADDEGVEGRYRNISFAITDTQLNPTAGTFLGLVGNYYGETVSKGNLIAKENGFSVVDKSAGLDIAANTAYVSATCGVTDQLTVVISADEITDIAKVMSNAAKGGKIYSVDGTYLGTGNINTVLSKGRGMYIINGMKVMVK